MKTLINCPPEPAPSARPKAGCIAVLLASCLLGNALPVGAQVILYPNQITGTIAWNNPAGPVLNFLTTSGFSTSSDNPWTPSTVTARQVLSGQNQGIKDFFPTSRTSTPYEITVQGDNSPGIQYDVSTRMTTVGGNSYFFATAASDGVTYDTAGNLPGPQVLLDFIECAGLIRVHYRDPSGASVPVDSSGVYARIPANANELQAYGGPPASTGATDHTLIVRGGNTFDLTVSANVHTGSDPFLNYITFHTSSNYTVTVPCDGTVDVTLIIPDLSGSQAGGYGQIIGVVDMLTEKEHWVDDTFTVMSAYDGPQGNLRMSDVGVQPTASCGSPSSPFVGTATCTSAGQFILPNLLPSDYFPALNDPAGPRPYSLLGRLIYGIGQRFQRFETPVLHPGFAVNTPVTVTAGGTVDLGNLYVMNPGWVVGDVYLCCPDEPGKTNSPLRYLNRLSDFDNNLDGIPDNLAWDYTSQVIASGKDNLGTGATKTAAGATGRTLFPGSFHDSGPDQGHFVGDYRLTLGGLNGETTRWDQRTFYLNYVNADPANHLSSQVIIRNNHYLDVEVVPTQTITNHHRYGMSRVVVTFHSDDPGTTLYHPRITGNGSWVGADFEGHAADYTAQIHYADGTPKDFVNAAVDGQIIMCLPQGNYTFAPELESVNGGSSTHNVLPNFSQYVGKCSSITSTPCLQLAVTNAPDCPTNPAVTIAGVVTGCTNIASITYRLNGGPLVTVCNNCGINPSFSFGITLAGCENQLLVTATDVKGDVASVSQTLHFDVTPPVVSGCTNLVVAADPGTNGAVVSYSVTALDNCDGPVPVVYSPPPGSFFPIGSTVVTASAWDHCLNTNTCTFTVTVTGGGTNCCDECYPPYPLSISVPIVPGINYLANPLCHGTNNTLGVLLPNVPDGTTLKKWDRPTGTYSPEYSFDSGFGGWVDTGFNDASGVRLEPGEGFLLINPNGPFTNTWTGCLPDCPPPCLPTNGCVLVGRRGPGVALWSDLSSCPPTCGTEVRIWNGTGFNNFTFDPLQGWLPYAPVVAEGHSAFVCLDANTVCCTNNLVVNGSFELTSPSVGANGFNNALDPLTGVPGWTTTAGEFLEVWGNTVNGIPAAQGVNQLEINAQSDDQTVSQVITNLSTNCPAEFCFQYTGRFGLVSNSPNNDLTVTLNGGFAMSVTLDPARYTTNGWLRFCTNFTPSASTLTIAFRGHPHFSNGTPATEGGAHIDDVSVTQCCPTNPCMAPTVLNCPTNKSVECGSAWTFDSVTATNDCCGTNVTITLQSTVTNIGACLSTYTRTWLATDCLSNNLTCTQTVTVVDTTAPMFTNCPASTNLGCNPANIPDCDPAVGATDDCSVATVTCARLDTTNGCAYTRTLTYTATDSCSNSITCVQVITWTVNAESHFFSTLAGSTVGSADGPGNIAQFFYPSGLAVDGAGVVYVADNNNHTIRKISSAGNVTTLAGLAGNPGIADGNGSAARFDFLTAVAVDGAGNVFVTDLVFSTIRKITPAGDVTTYAGSPGGFGSADGNGGAAQFYGPYGVAVDGAGYVYVADGGNHTIRKISPARDVTTLAGSAGNSGSTDGLNGLARFQNPQGLAVDSVGNLYVADTGNNTIRKITPAGDVTTLAGLAGNAGSADGPGNTARFDHPSGPAVDSAGNVYVADSHNHTIRKITPAGFVTTLAGAVGVIANVNGAAANARFAFPNGVAVDSAGNLFVVDNGNHSIRAGLKSASLVITCATNKTVECGSAWNFDPPSASDACCSNLTAQLISTTSNVVSFCQTDWTAIWQVMDCCTNLSTCTQTVSVVDTTPPVIAGCTNIIVSADAGTNGAVVFYPVTALDNCAGVVPVICEPPSGSFFPPGQTVVICTAVDFCGNTNTCSHTVTVTGSTNSNCCDNCTTNDYVSYTVVVEPGFNFLANALCRGTNTTLNALLTNAPDGAMVYKWDWQTQDFDPNAAVYIAGLGEWTPDLTLALGEGFALLNPGSPYTNTFFGCEPDCPLPCGPTNNACQILGAPGLGASTWTNLYRCPPACGTTLGIWNVANQDWDTYTYLNGSWLPSTPYWAVGLAVKVCVQTNTNCLPCTNALSFACPTDKTVECGTAWDFDSVSASNDCCDTNGVAITIQSTVTNGTCPRIFQRVWQITDCMTNIATCTQTVMVVDATPPILTCATNKTVECCASNATTLGSNYKYTVLKQFLVNGNDGETPRGGLHDGGDGFLYGLTYRGGNYQKGTVYKVDKNGGGFAVLHSFGATANDGEKPSGGLVEDANGTLFGCTDGGGASGAGTIFQIEKNGTGYLKLKSINPVAGDGRSPATGLIRGSDGAFYGTTRASWSDTGKGTVFKFEKVGPSYVYTVLHQFPDGAVTIGDGETPWASLLEARDGRLYGATLLGGSGGRGTIFTLNKDGSDYTVLVNLTGLAGDGARPYAALIEAANEDALYFTTRNGGGGERGTVCKLQRAGGIGDYTVLTQLMQFPAGTSDGRQPFSPLVEGSDGGLYGTAYVGGSGGFGTVFRMQSDGSSYTVLKSFSNTGDGRSPFAGLIQDGSGVLYGTAEGNGGVVFKLEPEAPCGWTFDPPTATDDCCTNLLITELGTVTNGLCPQVISRTWQVMDCCSNISTCTQTVTVVDHTPPVIVGCSNIFITIPHGQSSANVNFFVTATDSCSSPVTLTFTPPAGIFPVGLTPVTCVAEDACGNSSTCQFNVKVTEALDCPDLAVNVTATYPGPKLVHLVGTDTPCCGADFSYHIHYANNGVLPVSGATIQFKYPQSCSIVSIASPCIPPVTYSAFTPNLTRSCSGPFIPSSGLETFNLPTLNPGDRCTLSVKVHLCCDIMAPCGDQLPLKAQATILPLLPTDCKLGNNVATLSVRPCCSHDPNDCTVSPPGCGPEGFIHRDQALTYRIRFQNEGAGVAHEVGVVDILDEDLDLSTLEILDTSHPYLLEQNGRELLWIFHNIDLPSQNDDEDASQGFVTFRIRPFANAPVGTVIENSADVFFDANDPLTTVTTVNTITENPVPVAAFAVAPQPGSAGFVNDFHYTGGTPGAQCQWNFGTDATPQTSTDLNPSGVVFVTPGQHLVVLETSLGGCVAAPAVQLVTVGRPTLSLLQTATDLSLSWAGDGYVVQETESLSPPIQWHTIVATPTFVGGWYRTSIPLSTMGARFYRLTNTP